MHRNSATHTEIETNNSKWTTEMNEIWMKTNEFDLCQKLSVKFVSLNNSHNYSFPKVKVKISTRATASI